MMLKMSILINQLEKQFVQSKRAILSTLILLTILTANSLPTYAYTIGDYWICKDLDKSSFPYKPIEPTTVFYTSDERVYVLLTLENVRISHDAKIEIYHEDTLFNTSHYQIPDPRSEGYDFWETFSYYNWLSVKGYASENMPGQWRFEIYIDNQRVIKENFEIRSTTPATTTTTTTTPTTTTTSTPPPAPPPRRTEPQEQIQTTNRTTTQQEIKTEQPNFLSNPMYLTIIMAAVIIVIISIALAMRKKPVIPEKPVTPEQKEIKQTEISKKHCIHCGEPLEIDDPFCGSCGEKVE